MATDPKDHLERRGFLTIHMLMTYLQKYHPLRAVSYPTLQRYVDKGYFTYTKVGGQFRIPKVDIDKYVEQGTDPDAKPYQGRAIESIGIEHPRPAPKRHTSVILDDIIPDDDIPKVEKVSMRPSLIPEADDPDEPVDPEPDPTIVGADGEQVDLDPDPDAPAKIEIPPIPKRGMAIRPIIPPPPEDDEED